MITRGEQLIQNKQITAPEDMDLLGFTTDIVAAYVSNHKLEVEALSSLINKIYSVLENLKENTSLYAANIPPAVSIEKSIHNDYIICLEDGQKLKMLKRHLKAAYNMTPEQYRLRWGLPPNYPMVAPNYARKRSDVSKNLWEARKKGVRKAI